MKFLEKKKITIKEFSQESCVLIYPLNKTQLDICINIIEKEYVEGSHFCEKYNGTGIKIYRQNCYAVFNGNPYGYGLGSNPKNIHDMSYNDFIRKFG